MALCRESVGSARFVRDKIRDTQFAAIPTQRASNTWPLSLAMTLRGLSVTHTPLDAAGFSAPSSFTRFATTAWNMVSVSTPVFTL